jgi:hypothetical protein
VPEEQEIEVGELQDKVHEVHAEHEEHGDEKAANWTKSIALTTAILAVFAAVGALQAGGLVNEALIDQIKASDTWNQYQASREKTHLYTVALNTIEDAGPIQSAPPAQRKRAEEYKKQLDKETDKSKDLDKEARKLQQESEHHMHAHHKFAYEVALLQVAIALGAVSALTRVRWVWGLSMALGAVGVVLFILGFIQL